MYPNIERLTQLHECVIVSYEVDRYKAEFYTDDGERIVIAAHGDTIEAALTTLNRVLIGSTLDQIRQK